jgi:hypothetical protein
MFSGEPSSKLGDELQALAPAFLCERKIDALSGRLLRASKRAGVPATPDTARIDAFLTRAYQQTWRLVAQSLGGLAQSTLRSPAPRCAPRVTT